MTAAIAVAGLLAAGVALAWVRLVLWWRGGSTRSGGARLLLLAVGQPVLAALLYLTLFPPPARLEARATLTVLTRGARGPAIGAVALPEAGAIAGAELAPDLATALRRHPGTRRLEVRGEGLELRDADAAAGRAIGFAPPAAPTGLVALAGPPEAVAPGAGFAVGGEASGIAGGSAALLDPSGAEGPRVPFDRDGGFALAGAARVPGTALFRVRLRDARGRVIEEADVPVRIAAPAPIRVLYLAGAPDADTKYWRRWATDAGLSVTMRVALGGGLALGDPPPPLTAAALARVDLAIVDERSWAALSPAERGALAAAVRGGMGLLLRVTGPLPAAVRGAWAGFGLPLEGGAATLSSRLTGSAAALGRRPVLVPGAATIPLLRDADGAVLVAWHVVALGRVGAWTLADAFALVTSGSGARFGELWGTTVAALARPLPGAVQPIAATAFAGERVTLCGLGAGARVVAPEGMSALRLDSAAGAGCAGYWPRLSGWHVLRQAGGDTPFYVYPAGALPGVRAQARRDRTLALTRSPAPAPAETGQSEPGAAWPWLLALLVVAAGLWRLERGRRGGAAEPLSAG